MTAGQNLQQDRSRSNSPYPAADNNQRASLRPFLDVPLRNSRRGSFDSTFSGSDISELSFGSTSVEEAEGPPFFRPIRYTPSSIPRLSSPSAWRQKLQIFWLTNYGAFLVLVSQFFGVAMSVATRLLETDGPHGKPMHPFQILFVRQSITTLLCVTYAVWSKSIPYFPLGPPGKVRLLLVTRGLFGFGGVSGLYFSLVYLPVSEAVVLSFLAPTLACYAYSILLPGETFSRNQQLAGFVSLIGVVFIARPFSLLSSGTSTPPSSGTDDVFHSPHNSTMKGSEEYMSQHVTTAQHLQAVGIALLGVIGGCGAMTSIRAIGTRAHAFVSVTYFSAWCTFVSLIALIAVPSISFRLPQNLVEWGLLSILGFCGFVMQGLLTMGLAYGGPSGQNKDEKQVTDEDIEMDPHEVDPQIPSCAAPRGSMASQGGLSPKSQPQHRTKTTIAQQTPPIKVSGTRATSMIYTQMLFALVADKLVWGVTPTVLSWFGFLLILGGAIWVATDNSKNKEETKPAQSSRPWREVHNSSEEQTGLLENVDFEFEATTPSTPDPGIVSPESSVR